MARLIYSAIASADGYVEDTHGNFAWAEPDAELFGFVNELERPIGTYLYGRRMYQTMRYWETAPDLPDQPAHEQDFARIWRAADKVVFSATLPSVSTARTRLERSFDLDLIRQLKQAASRDLTVAGPTLAASALAAGLVDELQLMLLPLAVGGGKPALPAGARLGLQLLRTRTFASGAVYLGYRPVPA